MRVILKPTRKREALGKECGLDVWRSRCFAVDPVA